MLKLNQSSSTGKGLQGFLQGLQGLQGLQIIKSILHSNSVRSKVMKYKLLKTEMNKQMNEHERSNKMVICVKTAVKDCKMY